MTDKLRVVEHRPGCLLVLGTDQLAEAAKVLPADVKRWAGSFSGKYARRDRRWLLLSDYSVAKDARPGCEFVGVKRDD